MKHPHGHETLSEQLLRSILVELQHIRHNMVTQTQLDDKLTDLETALTAAIGRIPAPVDLQPEADRVDALTAQANAINPAPPTP